MTTEDKALALVNEVNVERGYAPYSSFRRDFDNTCEALCRAIEQHEAFKQEVSDVVRDALPWCEPQKCVSKAQWVRLSQLITKPKPDPLREIAEAWGLHNTVAKSWVEDLRATLEARGFEIREKSDD